MKIKAILTVTETKPDVYSNTYSVGEITNTRTGKSFRCKTNHERNARLVLNQLIGGEWHSIKSTIICTGYARLSSLPDAPYMNLPDFAKALRQIGFSVPAARVEDFWGEDI